MKGKVYGVRLYRKDKSLYWLYGTTTKKDPTGHNMINREGNKYRTRDINSAHQLADYLHKRFKSIDYVVKETK